MTTPAEAAASTFAELDAYFGDTHDEVPLPPRHAQFLPFPHIPAVRPTFTVLLDNTAEQLAWSIVDGDPDLFDHAVLDVLADPHRPERISLETIVINQAAFRIPPPASVHELPRWATTVLDHHLPEAQAMAILAFGHDAAAAPGLLDRVRKAAWDVRRHGLVINHLIDALIDAGLVWVARLVAATCHTEGRTNEVSHMIKRIGMLGATDTRGFTGWNTEAAAIGQRYSRMTGIGTDVILATAARFRRTGQPDKALAYAVLAAVLEPSDPAMTCVDYYAREAGRADEFAWLTNLTNIPGWNSMPSATRSSFLPAGTAITAGAAAATVVAND